MGDFTAGLFEAKDHGFETVILADRDGNITEGPGFNVFALKGKTVVTPDAGVLHGITRRTALELCQAAGLATAERNLPIDELMQADEVFLSSSGGGIMPVSQIGERVFSNGRAGPVASRLRRDYFALLQDPNYRTPVSY
ncbi:aminotransferase class IV [Roseovarius sp. CAU 1744]|uniref:aminotransferase class IV n=1 Tax=Roseovarius sp. CAU 1744 TaxID=3140368 RepID=UPI00325C0B81